MDSDRKAISAMENLIGLRIQHKYPEYGMGTIQKAYVTDDGRLLVEISFDNGRKANPFNLLKCNVSLLNTIPAINMRDLNSIRDKAIMEDHFCGDTIRKREEERHEICEKLANIVTEAAARERAEAKRKCEERARDRLEEKQRKRDEEALRLAEAEQRIRNEEARIQAEEKRLKREENAGKEEEHKRREEIRIRQQLEIQRHLQEEERQKMAVRWKNWNLEMPEDFAEAQNREAVYEYLAHERKIFCFTHFTRASNLKSILEKGILPRNQIPEGAKWLDADRFDGMLSYSCFSVRFPNYRMFFKYREMYKDESYEDPFVMLLISPGIVLAKDTNDVFYFPTNAASQEIRNTVGLYKGKDGAKNLFIDRPLRDGTDTTLRQYLKLPDYYTTNPQAEVMIRGVVERRFIARICVENRGDAEEVLKYLPENSGHLLKLGPQLFKAREDSWYWRRNNGEKTGISDRE